MEQAHKAPVIMEQKIKGPKDMEQEIKEPENMEQEPTEEDNTLKFIEAVKEHKCIWDMQSEEYYNKTIYRAAWRSLLPPAEVLVPNQPTGSGQKAALKQKVAELQKVWVGLRDSYYKNEDPGRKYKDSLRFLHTAFQSREMEALLEFDEPSWDLMDVRTWNEKKKHIPRANRITDPAPEYEKARLLKRPRLSHHENLAIERAKRKAIAEIKAIAEESATDIENATAADNATFTEKETDKKNPTDTENAADTEIVTGIGNVTFMENATDRKIVAGVEKVTDNKNVTDVENACDKKNETGTNNRTDQENATVKEYVTGTENVPGTDNPTDKGNTAVAAACSLQRLRELAENAFGPEHITGTDNPTDKDNTAAAAAVCSLQRLRELAENAFGPENVTGTDNPTDKDNTAAAAAACSLQRLRELTENAFGSENAIGTENASSTDNASEENKPGTEPLSILEKAMTLFEIENPGVWSSDEDDAARTYVEITTQTDESQEFPIRPISIYQPISKINEQKQ